MKVSLWLFSRSLTATLTCALYGDLNDLSPGIFVPRQAVEAETAFLSSLFKYEIQMSQYSQLLRYEFIYKPKSAGEFSQNFRSTLNQMVRYGVLEYDQESDEICIARSGRSFPRSRHVLTPKVPKSILF